MDVVAWKRSIIQRRSFFIIKGGVDKKGHAESSIESVNRGIIASRTWRRFLSSWLSGLFNNGSDRSPRMPSRYFNRDRAALVNTWRTSGESRFSHAHNIIA